MLAAALRFAEDFGLSDELKTLATLELKTTKAKLTDLERNAVRILSKAELSLGGERLERTQAEERADAELMTAVKNKNDAA